MLDLLKRGRRRDERYRIAARYVQPGESVLDVCAGSGRLQKFLPENCPYAAMDGSPQFLSQVRKKSRPTVLWDLHQGWPEKTPRADIIIMVISFSQFRDVSAGTLLEDFKKGAKRVVIVEEVLERKRSQASFIQKIINYLCGTDYYIPVSSWYTRQEFLQLMRDHGYQCEEVSNRYSIGSYGFK